MSLGGHPPTRVAHRAVAGLAAIVLLTAIAVVGLRASYGYYSDAYSVTVDLATAGQGLHKGNDVKYRGIKVGEVTSIKLVDRKARLTLKIHHSAKIPSDVQATVEPNTFFGDEFVQLDGARRDGPPYLADGSKITRVGTGTSVEDLLASTYPVLEDLDTTDLATVVSEAAQVFRGKGADLARLFDSTVKTANFFHDTEQAQLDALDALGRFTKAVRDVGPQINDLSGHLNTALPIFNDARQKVDHFLTTLRPFADNLASLLSVNRPDLDRILTGGQDIVRTLLANRQNIATTIFGASQYVLTIASAKAPGALPDGSHLGFMKAFIDFTNLQNIICGLVNLPMDQLRPLQEALFGSHGLLDCSAILNGYPDTQPKTTNDSSPSGSGPTATTTPPSATSSTTPSTSSSTSAQQLTDELYGLLSAPDTGQPSGLGSVLGRLLVGGGS